VAIQARHPEWSPAAEVVQGVICASRQDMAGVMRAYGAAIASRHPTHAARAWFNGSDPEQAQLGRLGPPRAALTDRRWAARRGPGKGAAPGAPSYAWCGRPGHVHVGRAA
jgi:hypothetical protein